MKLQFQSWRQLQSAILLFCLSIVLYSCDTYNFSRPQPVDKENIYEFPKAFRGYWVGEEDNDSFHISKTHIDFFIKDSEKIVDGAWPRLDHTGGYIYPSVAYSTLKTIRYDSLKRPVDTISNYLVRDNYAYRVNEKQLLEKGYPCQVNNDTITVLKDDKVSIDLGQNAFLRKLNNNFYVLNLHIKPRLFDENGWWQLVIVEIKEKQSINLWYCTTELSKIPSLLYEYSNENYFDSKWTTADVLRLMEEGGFSTESKFIKPTKKNE
jgi:hypothetical protein